MTNLVATGVHKINETLTDTGVESIEDLFQAG